MNLVVVILSSIGAAIAGVIGGLFVFAMGCLFDSYDSMREADTFWGNLRFWGGTGGVGIGSLWLVVAVCVWVFH